ncbi:hypothetical protein BDF20DRAFT_833119 [Mycotypha africana]|uniref:uncharacterized protein n=1 Tax=Mycotypha africana TaxID=64632 RepID=UPI0023007938|nr:uncharacterized protein BDF20DRAFT_833119 [Mycotypha africana]KAI8988250.1 hypothetical protein BDF20DRAFT_833119 [Mycotypha africana]
MERNNSPSNLKQLLPSLPNELLEKILQHVDTDNLKPFLFLNKFSFRLVQKQVHKKVIFPSKQGITESDVIGFFERYGESVRTIVFPDELPVGAAIYAAIAQYCPKVSFLYSTNNESIGTLKNLCHSFKNVSFMTPLQDDERDYYFPNFRKTLNFYQLSDGRHMVFYRALKEKVVVFSRKKRFYAGANQPSSARISILQLFEGISSEFNHRNTFDSIFLSRIQVLHIRWPKNQAPLNSSQAQLLSRYCANVRVLAASAINKGALRLILNEWHSLASIIISSFLSDDIPQKIHSVNRVAINTIRNHKRVWYLDESSFNYMPYYFIGLYTNV